MNLFDKLPKAASGVQGCKDHLFAVADFALDLCRKARKDGILALEEGVADDDFCPACCGDTEKFLFRQLTVMMTDGIDQEHLGAFAKYYIASIAEDDPAVLPLMIGAEGILAIQRGDNPWFFTCNLLAAMMGPELCNEYLEHLDKTREDDIPADSSTEEETAAMMVNDDGDSAEKKYGLLQRAGGIQGQEVPCDMEDVGIVLDEAVGDIPAGGTFRFSGLSGIDDRGMQKILREVDCQCLAIALMPRNTEAVREKVLNNMWDRAARELAKDIQALGEVKKDYVKDCQEKMLSVALRLIECGEVIPPGEEMYFGEADVGDVWIERGGNKPGKFRFADLAELTDAEIRKILRFRRLCSGGTLLSCSFFPKDAQAVYERFVGSMTEEEVRMLREDIAFIGPNCKRTVIDAQKQVLEMADYILSTPEEQLLAEEAEKKRQDDLIGDLAGDLGGDLDGDLVDDGAAEL